MSAPVQAQQNTMSLFVTGIGCRNGDDLSTQSHAIDESDRARRDTVEPAEFRIAVAGARQGEQESQCFRTARRNNEFH